MLVEDFVYSGTLSIINPYSPVYHVVESDTGGMIPQSLRAVLSQWGKGEEAEKDRPKVNLSPPTHAVMTPDNTDVTIVRYSINCRFCRSFTSIQRERTPQELFSQLRGAKKYTNSVVSTIFSSLRMTPTTTCNLATRKVDPQVFCP